MSSPIPHRLSLSSTVLTFFCTTAKLRVEQEKNGRWRLRQNFGALKISVFDVYIIEGCRLYVELQRKNLARPAGGCDNYFVKCTQYICWLCFIHQNATRFLCPVASFTHKHTHTKKKTFKAQRIQSRTRDGTAGYNPQTS